jgi:hypothetical protein
LELFLFFFSPFFFLFFLQYILYPVPFITTMHCFQEGEILAKNSAGEAIMLKLSGGSAQGTCKRLCLPQSQLVVADNGQILQTTSTPTGLFVNSSGQLCSAQPSHKVSSVQITPFTALPRTAFS